MLKWIINIHAEDGTHIKRFNSATLALDEMDRQVGFKVDRAEITALIETRKYASITDHWGRTVEITQREVGTCKVCKGRNEPLYSLTKHGVVAKVCGDCWTGFECGVWDIGVKNGKLLIIKNALY